MWIEQLDIQGFGRLAGIYRFAPGLTLVVGDNEAGKSTLHEALVRALFGFGKQERKRTGSSARERFAPWQGGVYALTATFAAPGGRRIRAEWDFEKYVLHLVDLGTGEDLSQAVPLKGDDSALGRYLVDLDLEVFRQVYCLDQRDIEAVGKSVVTALQQAAEAGGDESVEEAVTRLNDFLRDRLGVHVTHLRPLPGGHLETLLERASELRQELDTCRSARDESQRLSADLALLEARRESLARRLLREERLMLASAVSRAAARLDQAQQLSASAASAPGPARRIPEDQVVALRGQLVALDRVVEALTEAETAAQAVRHQVASFDRHRTAVSAEIQALERYGQTDTRFEAPLRELRGQREALLVERRALGPVEIPTRDPRLQVVRTSRAALERDERRARSQVWLASAAGAASLTFALLVAAIAWDHRLFWGAGAAVALAVALQTARVRSARRLGRLLQDVGVRSVADLDERASAEDRAVSRAEMLADLRRIRAEALAEHERAIELEMSSVLRAAGIGGEGDTIAQVAAYLDSCARAADRMRMLVEFESLGREIAEQSKPIRDAERLRAEKSALESEILGTFAALGIHALAVAPARRVFEQAVAADAADDEWRESARSAAATLAAVLGSDTLESLTRGIADAQARLEAHLREHGEVAPDTERPEDGVEPSREVLAGQLQRLEVERATLRALIGEREARTGDPAVLEEELEVVERRIDRVQIVRDGLVIARGALEEAAKEAHRRVAPHLNTALARHLPAITGGRYREVVVGNDLALQVETPEHRKLVSADLLSRGTRDQIYLIERIEMARLLDSDSGRVPLLLDDPFARFDERRLSEAVTLLASVARDRQIVLFSEDRSLIDMVRRHDPDASLIDLASPPGGHA